jgi:putative membrane protein
VALQRVRRILELMAKHIDPAVAASLTEAVRELELCSCAEVVIEIRSRSGSYAHADARFASVIAFLALLVLLFSPWPFAAGWVAIDVAIAWILGLFLSRKSDSVRHLMTARRERVAQARLVAASVFHDRGIANTIGETGVLVYLSLLEGHIELLADRGVLAAVPSLEWNRIAEAARAKHATTESLLEIVRAMKPLLERHLPSREGDVDELCNVPRFVTE